MRINGAIAAAVHQTATTSEETPAARPATAVTERSQGGGLLATLGAPPAAIAARLGRHIDRHHAAEARGIIVIGGSPAHASASDASQAARQRPLLGGIIIVGGSPVGRVGKLG